jgi:predicted enzyme related to lactoylglutathione lyase
MISNSSVPTNTMIGHVVYEDVGKAIAWLTKVFGFEEHFRYGAPDSPSGAQMHLGNAWIMLRETRPGDATPKQLGSATQSLSIFMENVDEHFQRAKAAGAKIFEDPHETEYGEYQYAAGDLDGHHWVFSRHAKDANPRDWGATVSPCAGRLAFLPRPRVCYLEIPAKDVNKSAEFYEKVFGWNIRHRGSDRPSFDDATGDVSGAWVKDRKIAGEPGVLPYIWVDGIEKVLIKIAAEGGKVTYGARPDSPGSTALIAGFQDPAGNVMGLYEEVSRG